MTIPGPLSEFSPTPHDPNVPLDACIDEQTLTDFHLGKLADAELEVLVARHLAFCAACEERLAQVPADPLVRLLQSTNAAQASDVETFTRIKRGAFLADPGVDMHWATTHPLVEPNSPRRLTDLPFKLDDYFVIRELGEGAFGKVYLAKDPRHDRLVALKVPGSKRPFTNQVRETFLAEARIIATLDHPRIVRLYDCREFDDGKCILVMRYVDGQSLAAAQSRGPCEAHRAAEIVAQIADALHYAHGCKVRHRDVKPSNIMLDSQGAAYLSDFGLAVNAELQPELTGDGAGTYPYMAPEQFSRGGQVDGRTDIWSLGVVLYELLAGRRPFSGRTIDAVRDEILNRPHKPLTSVAPRIDPQLSLICDRCLAKAPDQRYASADLLAADLRTYLNRPSRRRRRWQVALAVAVSLTILLAMYLWFGPPGRSVGTTVAGDATDRSADSKRPTGASVATPDANRDESGVWRPLFTRQPTPITWNNFSPNGFSVDTNVQRLAMQLEKSRGLLEFGELPTASFTVRYVVSLERWQGKVGFYWGFQRNQDAFPNVRHRCLSLNAWRKTDGRLYFEVDELGLVPVPYDPAQLMCPDSATFAQGSTPLPVGTQVALTLTIDQGQLVELRVNDAVCELKWSTAEPTWAATAPARFGFHMLNGFVTVENASLRTKEFVNGQEEDAERTSP